jgi:MFS family permease
VPVFLQQGQHVTAWHAGLTVLPQAVVTVVMMPIAGRLYDRIGARWPSALGLGLDGAGTLLMTGINADMTRTELAWWMMIRAAGLGLAMMPIITSGISSLPANTIGSGSAFNALTQRVSSSLGLAALTALATAQQAQYLADRAALLPALGADAEPLTSHLDQARLIAVWRELQLQVQAQAYSNTFLLTGLAALAGVGLALLLRHGQPTATGAAEPADAG